MSYLSANKKFNHWNSPLSEPCHDCHNRSSINRASYIAFHCLFTTDLELQGWADVKGVKAMKKKTCLKKNSFIIAISCKLLQSVK